LADRTSGPTTRPRNDARLAGGGDGFVDNDDYNGVIRPRRGAAIGTAAYLVEADLDRNGVINQSDYDIAVADDGKSSSGGVGEAGLFAKGVRNGVGYCGYIYNDESGLYTVRFRSYSPTLGRWLESDPVSMWMGWGSTSMCAVGRSRRWIRVGSGRSPGMWETTLMGMNDSTRPSERFGGSSGCLRSSA
jgi:RHS repeat-associated protein